MERISKQTENEVNFVTKAVVLVYSCSTSPCPSYPHIKSEPMNESMPIPVNTSTTEPTTNAAEPPVPPEMPVKEEENQGITSNEVMSFQGQALFVHRGTYGRMISTRPSTVFANRLQRQNRRTFKSHPHHRPHLLHQRSSYERRSPTYAGLMPNTIRLKPTTARSSLTTTATGPKAWISLLGSSGQRHNRSQKRFRQHERLSAPETGR